MPTSKMKLTVDSVYQEYLMRVSVPRDLRPDKEVWIRTQESAMEYWKVLEDLLDDIYYLQRYADPNEECQVIIKHMIITIKLEQDVVNNFLRGDTDE